MNEGDCAEFLKIHDSFFKNSFCLFGNQVFRVQNCEQFIYIKFLAKI